MANLDLAVDATRLLVALVDTPSVSGDEAELADAVEAALSPLPHLTVVRDGNCILAGTSLGREHRVMLAGHLDTVPIADNLPSRRDGARLYGCGTTDMKSGVAVMLRLARLLTEPSYDVTYIFYDCEEVEATRNGLGRIVREHPEWIDGQFAVLLEPTNAAVEAGCQGTLRARITVTGERAHSARSWLGVNAIHGMAPVLATLASYEPLEVTIDGLVFREGLNAVFVNGGHAGNVIPDECTVTVNYRFAPNKSVEEAFAYVRSVFDGYQCELVDAAPGALPGLSSEIGSKLVAAIGGEVLPKFGWTDVARFTQLGIPAVNYGPGDPNIAHTRLEYVELSQLDDCERVLTRFLGGEEDPAQFSFLR
ncbi:MAG: succinyl-diaminopimelate desuccinylase [Frankiales bacterium]|nr:succinyl-diaminopimelate desuccinylase [Frankiales bacterium]